MWYRKGGLGIMARTVTAVRMTFSDDETEIRFMSRNGRGTSSATGGSTIKYGKSNKVERKAALLALLQTRVPDRATTGQ